MYRNFGYNIIESNVSNVKLYIKNEDVRRLIVLFELVEKFYSVEQCKNIVNQVMQGCKENDDRELKVLALFICDKKISEYQKFDLYDRGYINIENGDIVITLEENDDFWKDEMAFFEDNSKKIKQYEKNIKENVKQKRKNFIDKNIKMSVVWIVMINMIVFLIIDFIYFVLKDKKLANDIIGSGSCSYIGVIDNGQVYRVITSMFLHGGWAHFSGNMVSLLAVGYFLEDYIGHAKFLFVYLLSGIIADFVSIGYNVSQGNISSSSIGASGAIFGVVGVVLALLIVNKEMLGKFGVTRLGIYIVYCLGTGFSSDNVDNAAHVGGVVVGFIIGVIMFYFVPKLKNNYFKI